MTPLPGQLIFVPRGLISALLSRPNAKGQGAEVGREATWVPFQSPVLTNSSGRALSGNFRTRDKNVP